MKISVAMATYNGEAFVLEQLESIRIQTRAVDEVRICDDCSNDRTVELIKEYIAENHLADKWQVTVNERNLGYASNFMAALDQTTGDVIFLCDQDDIWMHDRVEQMCSLMENKPEIMVLGSEFEPFAQSADSLKVPGWEMKMMTGDGSLEHMKFVPKNVFIGCQGCTMCVNRKLLDACRKYWYTGWAHDEFVWKAALCLDGLYVYHKATLKRRLHSGNASLNKMHELSVRVRFLEDLLKSHQATLQLAEDVNLGLKERKLLRRNIKATTLRIELLRRKKIGNIIPLSLFYGHCYHKMRAIPVELLMALKG